jgi:hypothetical protein
MLTGKRLVVDIVAVIITVRRLPTKPFAFANTLPESGAPPPFRAGAGDEIRRRPSLDRLSQGMAHERNRSHRQRILPP